MKRPVGGGGGRPVLRTGPGRAMSGALSPLNPMQAPMAIDVHAFIDRGRREVQEDFFHADLPSCAGRPWLGVVADGMGGHVGGDVASRAGVLALKQAFDACVASRLAADEALYRATLAGHEAVLEEANRAGASQNMGATVVAFAIDGPMLYWCCAGDSRLYLWRRNRLEQLSRDFTLGEDLRQGMVQGGWTEEDIRNNPQFRALTSFMGTDDWRCHQGSRPLQPGDCVIACSDGVYGTLGDDGMSAVCEAQAVADARQLAQALHRRVLEIDKPRQDNSSAIVVCCRGPRDEVEAAVPVVAEPARGRDWKPLAAGVAGAAALALAAFQWGLAQSQEPQPPPAQEQLLAWQAALYRNVLKETPFADWVFDRAAELQSAAALGAGRSVLAEIEDLKSAAAVQALEQAERGAPKERAAACVQALQTHRARLNEVGGRYRKEFEALLNRACKQASAPPGAAGR